MGPIVLETNATDRMTREDRDLVASLSMTKERKLLVQRLGLVDYESALAVQKQTELAVKSGVQPDTLLLLEHPHTLTIGR
ncbi:MAG TPA: hypothetical protein VFD75_00215, partial [Pyrinomonadaceae bacterium]|nr:hypothetical protein [Pyrinomonadaceae bacterium]